jgi:hypothetical protein
MEIQGKNDDTIFRPTKNLTKKIYLNDLIKIEAEMPNKKSTSTKSFIEQLANDTKNYDRISQIYMKHNNNNNKDSGVDSHREDRINIENNDDYYLEGMYKYRKPNNNNNNDSDIDSYVKQNRKMLKRLNNNNKKARLYTKTSDSPNSDQLSLISSVDSLKLKHELKKSKILDQKIRKAIIDLLALDKLEKQKKLNILKQERVIKIQKMKLDDRLQISKSLTNINPTRKIIFPSIVKKYNPYGGLDDVTTTTITSNRLEKFSEMSKDFDQFYLHNKSSLNYGNDISFNEIMNIIEEIEADEKLTGCQTNSNYYFNGRLIKGANNLPQSGN